MENGLLLRSLGSWIAIYVNQAAWLHCCWWYWFGRMQSAGTDGFQTACDGVVGVRCYLLRRWRGAAAYTRGGCAPQRVAAVAAEGVLGAVDDAEWWGGQASALPVSEEAALICGFVTLCWWNEFSLS